MGTTIRCLERGVVDDAQRGDVVEWDGGKLEVAAMDGLGVERIVARSRPMVPELEVYLALIRRLPVSGNAHD